MERFRISQGHSSPICMRAGLLVWFGDHLTWRKAVKAFESSSRILLSGLQQQMHR